MSTSVQQEMNRLAINSLIISRYHYCFSVLVMLAIISFGVFLLSYIWFLWIFAHKPIWFLICLAILFYLFNRRMISDAYHIIKTKHALSVCFMDLSKIFDTIGTYTGDEDCYDAYDLAMDRYNYLLKSSGKPNKYILTLAEKTIPRQYVFKG